MGQQDPPGVIKPSFDHGDVFGDRLLHVITYHVAFSHQKQVLPQQASHLLAWHLVGVAGALGQFAGLQIPAPGPEMVQPNNMADIVDAYEQVMAAFTKQAATLTDATLVEEVPAFGGQMPRGKLLRAVIDHQTHHRGQMTVLLRQAGLVVPPVMGPTQEMQK